MKHGATAAEQSRAAAKRRDRPKAQAPEQGIVAAHLRETLDPERRRAMVAEAAYFYAERRGFEPGHEMEDWLAAEGQIDATLRVSDQTTAASPGKGSTS